MSTITIDPRLYKAAEQYAKSHNVSLNALVESYFRRLVHATGHRKGFSVKPVKDLSPEVRQLIGIVKPDAHDAPDLNGDRYRTDYLKEKYSL